MSETQQAVAEMRVDGARVPGDLRRARKMFARGFGRIEKLAKKSAVKIAGAFRGAFGKLRKLMRFAGIGAGLGLGVGLIQGAKDALDFERVLTRLGIQAGLSANDLNSLRSEIDAVSTETGVGREKVLDAARQYVSLTGDVNAARKAMETMARVQVASGAAMGDISATAAALTQNLQIDPSKLEDAFSIILAQGKAGAVELRELSSLLSGLTPTFAKFGTTGTEGMSQLGSMVQLARQGFGSGNEAVTGLQAMMTAFIKNAKRFEKAGVKIFDPKTKKLRDLRSIVMDLSDSKLVRDPTKLAKAFGRVEGLKAFDQLVKNRGALDQLIEKTRNAKDVGEDYEKFQNSTAGKLQKSMNQLKQTVANIFTPEMIEQLAGWFKSAVAGAEALIGTLTTLKNFIFDKDFEVQKNTEAKRRLASAGIQDSAILGADRFQTRTQRALGRTTSGAFGEALVQKRVATALAIKEANPEITEKGLRDRLRGIVGFGDLREEQSSESLRKRDFQDAMEGALNNVEIKVAPASPSAARTGPAE